MPTPATSDTDPTAPDLSPEERVRRAAADLLGHEELRPGQVEAAVAVLEGRDTLAVMPTGSGKSAVYQLAAALLDGPTVVVSPLIALQKDQVEAIAGEDVGLAAAANSTISERDRRWIFEALESGGLEFLFVAPETLAKEETIERLAAAGPSLFVVDEAHCISEWGHDFRTDYLRLAAAAEAVGRPPILALTATASPVVREEIVERLRLRDPEVVVRGFDRPNLRIEVETHHDERSKLEALVAHVGRLAAEGGGTGIAYVATRREAEEVAALLAERTGLRVGHYHGGMRAADRRAAQDAFMDDELDVVVATTAFGMGIDKADVRYVIHVDVPESVDSWYQEVGRAGRDGEPALALLLWRPEDLGLRKFFAGGGTIGRDELERVAALVGVAGEPVPAGELADEAGLGETRLAMAVARLEEVGALTVAVDGTVAPVEGAPSAADAAEEADEGQEVRRQVEKTRLEMVRSFAETRSCRRRFVLTYFGEDAPERCGHCDTCDDDRVVEDVGAERWPVQRRVVHGEWGEGTILRHEADAMVVLFDEGGYRTLSVELVESGGLLELL